MKNENLGKNKKTTKWKIIDIVSWILVIALFATSLTLLISRKANGRLDIFGSRYDTVLTTSMASRNEEHAEFLKGTSQIQKMDVVRSKTVNKKTKLKVKDVVLFNNPYIGVDMHRIVDIKVEQQDEIYLKKTTVSESGGINLLDGNAAIYTNTIHFTQAEFDIYSKEQLFSNKYVFSIDKAEQAYSHEVKQIGEKYCHTITLTKANAKACEITMVPKGGYDYSLETIKEIRINSTYGELKLNGKDFTVSEDENILQCIRNTSYLYEIRGDAAKTSDGWFSIDKIYSRVDKVIPKAGYMTRFFTSSPGIILLIGLGLIILAGDFLIDFLDKKDKKQSEEKETKETNEKN